MSFIDVHPISCTQKIIGYQLAKFDHEAIAKLPEAPPEVDDEFDIMEDAFYVRLSLCFFVSILLRTPTRSFLCPMSW